MKEEKYKGTLVCTDLCEHCVYIGDGDFICDETNQLVINDWISEICLCPEKMRLIK